MSDFGLMPVSTIPVEVSAAISQGVLQCVSSSVDEHKTTVPVGDLISDKAWHVDLTASAYTEHAQSLEEHAQARQLNHSAGRSAIAASASVNTSGMLNAGHNKGLEPSSDDHKVTDYFTALACSHQQISGVIVTILQQMVDEAVYAETQAQLAQYQGDSDKAKDIRDDARSVIDGLGTDLDQSITQIRSALAVPALTASTQGV